MEYSKFGNSEILLSRFSLGGATLGDVYQEKELEEKASVVETAFQNGINYIDVSPFYGNTKAESNLGKILKMKNIPKESIYISTKVGRYGDQDHYWFDFSVQRTEKSIKESLKRLGIDCVDFAIAHDVEFAPSIDIIINETLPTLERLKKAGKVRYIGFSGYPLSIFKKIIDRSHVNIDFVLTYCHYCLFDTSLKNYMPYFKSKGVTVFNASPFGMGLLTNNDPPFWHPASDELKKACKQAAIYAKSHGMNIANLAMKFSYCYKDVVTTLASAYCNEYLKDNLQAVSSGITIEEEYVINEIKEKFFKNLKRTSWEREEDLIEE